MTITDTTGTIAASDIAHYPINIRLTMPFLPRSFFLTLIVGPERRTTERRRAERGRHPLTTRGNMAALISSLAVLGVATLFVARMIAGI